MDNLVRAPSSEWDKVIGYIRKGSTFDKVAIACKNNPSKLKWRYMILKELGLLGEAGYFTKFMTSSQVEELDSQHVTIPEKYGEIIDEWQTVGFGPFTQYQVKTKVTNGPFVQLVRMGISFDIFKADLSDDEHGNAVSLGIEPIKGFPNVKVVVMYNGVDDSTQNHHFYFEELVSGPLAGKFRVFADGPESEDSILSITEFKSVISRSIYRSSQEF